MRALLSLPLLAAALLAVGGCASTPPAASTTSSSRVDTSSDSSNSSQSQSQSRSPSTQQPAATQPSPDTPSAAASAAPPPPPPPPLPSGKEGSNASTQARPTSSSTANAGQSSSTGAPPPAQIPAKRRTAATKHLNDSKRSLDAERRKDQQRVARKVEAPQGAQGGIGTAKAQPKAALSKHTSDAAGTSGTAVPVAQKSGGTRGGTGSHRRGSGKKPLNYGGPEPDKTVVATARAGNGATAREIPDRSGDDIIASRLRKAAEQETNSSLKEKLWQEYADYRKNAPVK
jgi:hypothetical protein